jgi:redox-sensitive bicupin YhaK (pirin superfamily)
MDNGAIIKIICGKIDQVKGPAEDIIIDPEYLDIDIPPHTQYTHPTKTGYTVFTFVFEGRGYFCPEKKPFTFDMQGSNYFDMDTDPLVGEGTIILFEDGDEVVTSTEDEPVRFLLISGKPLNEPVAWHGPIVMNTRDELRVALEEFQRGTFVKKGLS